MNKSSILKIILHGFLLFTFFFCLSCSNNVVAPSTNFTNVQGKVTDYYGNGLANIKLELNSNRQEMEATTNPDGSFLLTNVMTPYTITVLTDSDNSVTFNELSNPMPKLPINKFQSEIYHTQITVIIPSINNNQEAKVIYFDDSGLYTSMGIIFSTNFFNLQQDWSINQSTTGKIAVLTYTKDNSGNIISYDNYGEKPLSITNEVYTRIVFNDIDLGTNPAEINLTGDLNLPVGINNPNAKISMNRNSFGNVYNYGFTYAYHYNSGSFSVLTPIIPGNIYKYYVNFFAFSIDGLTVTKTVELNPSFNNIVTVNVIPTLISPQDNEENVDYNTLFSISNEQPAGIYEIQFSYIKNYIQKKLIVFTERESFRLPAVRDTNFVFPSNTEVTWSVSKFSGFNSVDKFTEKNPNGNSSIKEILQTITRKFKTSSNP